MNDFHHIVTTDISVYVFKNSKNLLIQALKIKQNKQYLLT